MNASKWKPRSSKPSCSNAKRTAAWPMTRPRWSFSGPGWHPGRLRNRGQPFGGTFLPPGFRFERRAECGCKRRSTSGRFRPQHSGLSSYSKHSKACRICFANSEATGKPPDSLCPRTILPEFQEPLSLIRRNQVNCRRSATYLFGRRAYYASRVVGRVHPTDFLAWSIWLW